PLPGARQPEQLLTPRRRIAYPDFERFRDQLRIVASATAFLGQVPFAVSTDDDPQSRPARFFGHLVSPEYFSTLGVTPEAGRFFAAETEKPGLPPVVVVTHRFWREHLRADRRAIGRRIRINGRPVTVVGVAPEPFLGVWPWESADLFVPLT